MISSETLSYIVQNVSGLIKWDMLQMSQKFRNQTRVQVEVILSDDKKKHSLIKNDLWMPWDHSFVPNQDG